MIVLLCFVLFSTRSAVVGSWYYLVDLVQDMLDTGFSNIFHL